MLIVEAKQLALTANKVYTSHLHAYTITCRYTLVIMKHIMYCTELKTYLQLLQ